MKNILFVFNKSSYTNAEFQEAFNNIMVTETLKQKPHVLFMGGAVKLITKVEKSISALKNFGVHSIHVESNYDKIESFLKKHDTIIEL